MKNLFATTILCFFITSSFAQLHPVKYQDGDQTLNAWYTSVENSKKGVLILPAWKGVDHEARQAALDLQKLGYHTFIADIYGEGNIPQDNASAAKIATFYKTNHKDYVHRIQLALKTFIELGIDANEIVVIGYCFGGTGALETARAQLPVKGVVSIHGGLSKGDRPHDDINTKVLVLHGAEDKSVPESDVEALRQELKLSNADWQLIYYAGCGHTWTNPESKDYNEVMAKRSWRHLEVFLEEVLK